MPTINRQQFLRGAAGAAMSLTAGPLLAKHRTRRPNVLLVLVDELRAQALGHRGDPNVSTPTIDGFARQSIDFRQAVSGTPVCCPSRASLLTGQYPRTHGIYINDVQLKPRHTTLGEAFSGAGYQTGYIGKWHLYGSPQGIYERRTAFIPPQDRYGFGYWKAGECTHNYQKSLYYAGNDPTPRYWPGFDAIPQTADAAQFVADHAKGENPYFLVLSLGPPHFPYMPPEEYRGRWADRPITLRANVPDKDREAAIKELRGYYAQTEVLDDCFARILSAVEKSGAAEDTIVILMSDHGEMAFSQGVKYKNVPWDESVRIPVLIRYPRKFGHTGRQVEAPINMPDIMPTLLSLAGIPTPNGVEGYDWTPYLAGHRRSDEPTSAFLSMDASFGSMRTYGIAEFRGVRTARYCYVRSIKGPWLLYDNVADPYQLENLVDRPQARHIQAELEADLKRHLKRRKDQFRPGIDYLRQDGLSHYVEVMLPIGEAVGPDGQWRSTLHEGDPNSIASDPGAFNRLRF